MEISLRNKSRTTHTLLPPFISEILPSYQKFHDILAPARFDRGFGGQPTSARRKCQVIVISMQYGGAS